MAGGDDLLTGLVEADVLSRGGHHTLRNLQPAALCLAKADGKGSYYARRM